MMTSRRKRIRCKGNEDAYSEKDRCDENRMWEVAERKIAEEYVDARSSQMKM
jgi:hypothetical protein